MNCLPQSHICRNIHLCGSSYVFLNWQVSELFVTHFTSAGTFVTCSVYLLLPPWSVIPLLYGFHCPFHMVSAYGSACEGRHVVAVLSCALSPVNEVEHFRCIDIFSILYYVSRKPSQKSLASQFLTAMVVFPLLEVDFPLSSLSPVPDTGQNTLSQSSHNTNSSSAGTSSSVWFLHVGFRLGQWDAVFGRGFSLATLSSFLKQEFNTICMPMKRKTTNFNKSLKRRYNTTPKAYLRLYGHLGWSSRELDLWLVC